MKHTPGPWGLRNEFGMQGLVYPKDKEYPVAAVTGYYSRAGQAEPNARLIATAPEMLEALQAVVRQIEPILEKQGFAYVGAIQSARAAIAKATGETA